MGKLALILGVLILSGCSTTKYVMADVPPPPVVERPVLATDELKKGDSADVVLRAHRVAIKQLQGYAVQLETLLNAYRKLSESR